MFDNGIQREFQGEDEGPFVAGAFQGESLEAESEAGELEYEDEYSEREGELYEGPRGRGRRPRRRAVHAPPPPPPPPPAAADSDEESPFLNEDEILQDLAGEEGQYDGDGQCTCGRRMRPAAPPRRRVRPISHEYEYEGGGGRPTLSNGSRGQVVLDLQSSLTRLGISPGQLDGIFGPKTDAAVRQFQQSRGIEVDGVVGPITWGELDKALGGAPPANNGGSTGAPTTGPTGSAAAIVAEAAKHVGYPEGPNNANKFSAYFGVNNVAWCAYFVSYVHTMAGIPFKMGRTDDVLAYVKRIGRFSTSNPAPGDIIIFDWDPSDNDPSGHVGIVESVTSDKVTTIEGNTSKGVVGRNKWSRSSSSIVGYGRLWTTGGTSSGGSTGTSSGGSTGGSTGGSSATLCANVKPTSTVNPYVREFTAAATRAGVPQSWATNAALIQLVGHESSWKPSIKARSSSAFGLFQFLKSTWAKFLPEVPYASTDVTWQATGGYRYIRAAYKTPERAWAFWQSTVCKNASLAPADLQSKSRLWISKGYAGY